MYGGRNVLVILNPHGGDTHAMSVSTSILYHLVMGRYYKTILLTHQSEVPFPNHKLCVTPLNRCDD